MSVLIALLIFFLFVGYMTHLERRHMEEILEEDRRKEAEHQARMKAIHQNHTLLFGGDPNNRFTFFYMAGRRAGKTLRGAELAAALYLPAESWYKKDEPYFNPGPKKKHRSPRPNRRRKAQKLRAARQRKSWHQVLVHEDDDAR